MSERLSMAKIRFQRENNAFYRQKILLLDQPNFLHCSKVMLFSHKDEFFTQYQCSDRVPW